MAQREIDRSFPPQGKAAGRASAGCAAPRSRATATASISWPATRGAGSGLGPEWQVRRERGLTSSSIRGETEAGDARPSVDVGGVGTHDARRPAQWLVSSDPARLEVAKYVRWKRNEWGASPETIRDYEATLARLAIVFADLDLLDFAPPVGREADRLLERDPATPRPKTDGKAGAPLVVQVPRTRRPGRGRHQVGDAHAPGPAHGGDITTAISSRPSPHAASARPCRHPVDRPVRAAGHD